MCELLSPVGNMDVLMSSINAGCDAVYLSGINFSARSFAGNFNNEEMIEAIKICHLYGVKVYAAVNTIIYETEVDRFIKYIEFLYRNNIDAVIMQDIGMIDLVRKVFPLLDIHASTQSNITNVDTVKFFESIGVKRVVLARETPIDLIKQIKAETNIEVEVFIHGALCMSYSGVCLMSSLIGGRSANRGTCAQCCRQKYSLEVNNKLVEQDKYLLSCRDLNTLSYIHELIDINVDSLKIEGRMKSREYVYLATSIYRKTINNYLNNSKTNIDSNDIINLKKVFNREFTNGFMFSDLNSLYVNKNRPNHVGIPIGSVIDYKNGVATIKLTDNLNINDGIRILSDIDTGCIVSKMICNNKLVYEAFNNDVIKINIKDKVNINDKVVKTTDYRLIKELDKKICINKKIKIDIKCILRKNEPVKLTVSDNNNIIDIKSDEIVESSINRPLLLNEVKEKLNKLGNTIYEANCIDIIMDNNIFIQLSVLNNLKRKAIDLLNKKRIYNNKILINKYSIDLPDFNNNKIKSVLISDYNDYKKVKDKYDIIYVDSIELNTKIKNSILRLPRVCEQLPDINDRLLVNDLGSVYKYKDIDTDALNVVNSYSVAFLHSLGVKKITLSYELNTKQIKCIVDNYIKRYNKRPNLEVIVSSYPEVMVTKYNILENYKSNTGYLVDRLKNKYKVKYKDNLTYIYNYKRIVNTDDLYSIGINSLRVNLDD